MRVRHLLPSAVAAAGAFLLVADPASADDIVGDDDPETLDGTAGDDDIQGLGGDDTIDAGAGDDRVNGGDDDDVIDAGPGDDGVSGGEGDDEIQGGDGDDVISGDSAVCEDDDAPAQAEAFFPCSDDGTTDPDDDVIDGGAGNDFIVGDGGICDSNIQGDGVQAAAADPSDDDPDSECDDGDDTIEGGDGNDLILGDGNAADECLLTVVAQGGIPNVRDECVDGGDDDIDGGAGTDWVEGGGGNDEVAGGTGSDLLFGDSFLDLLAGGEFPILTGDLDELGDELAELFELLGRDPADLTDEEYDQLLSLLTIFFLLGEQTPGGDDVVCGGDADWTAVVLPGSSNPGVCVPDGVADVLLGMGGHDVLCADDADVIVLGGAGTDVPCPVVEGEIEVPGSGTVTGDLSADMRDLDDSFLEVDEEGDPNPFEFVVLNATLVSSSGDFDTYKTAKGTIVINRLTGEYTYTADPGAIGEDTVEYALQRRIVECPDFSDIEVFILDEEEGISLPNPCDEEVRARAIVEVGEDDFLRSLSKLITFLLGEAPTPPVVEPEVKTPRAAPDELARTGIDPLAMALSGLGLVALGAMAQAASRRRRLGFELR